MRAKAISGYNPAAATASAGAYDPPKLAARREPARDDFWTQRYDRDPGLQQSP